MSHPHPPPLAFTDQECKDASASSSSAAASSSPTPPLKRKKQNQGNTKKKPRVEVPMPSPPPSLTPQFASMNMVDIHSMQEMIHLVPHLSMYESSSSASAALAPFPGPPSLAKRLAIDPEDLVEKKRLHIEESQVNPTKLVLYNAKRAKLPVPIFFLADNPSQKLDQAIVCQRLREGFLSLPVFKAEFESRLLVQAGPMPLANGKTLMLPPCMYGS
jgi:hypothetical protein